MENYIIKNRKDILIYFFGFIIIVCIVVIINLANGNSIVGINPGTSQGSSASGSTQNSVSTTYNANAFSYGEQSAEKIKNLIEALPYISDDFRVVYIAQSNTMDVTSATVGVQELMHLVIFWLRDFPTVDYDAYTWVYHAIDQP